MNIIDIQNRLKGLSEEQLVQQMQVPTGEIPPFLILSEITRRQKMRSDFEGQRAQGEQESTVAQDAIAAAGLPAGFAGQMAGAMAPRTDPRMNTAAAPAAMPGGAGSMPTALPQGAMPTALPQGATAAPMTQGAVPVPGMADGGIVALNRGGFVNDGQRAPTFVSGGMRYIVNDQGELIPWGPEGEQPPAGFWRPEGGNIGASTIPFGARMGRDPVIDMGLSAIPADPTAAVPPLALPADPTAAVPPLALPEAPASPTLPRMGSRGSTSHVPDWPPPFMAFNQPMGMEADPPPGQTQAPFPPDMPPAQREAYRIAAQSPGITGVARDITEQATDLAIARPGAFLTDRLGRGLSYLGMPGLGATQLATADATRERIAQREADRVARAAQRDVDAAFIDFMADPNPESAALVLPGALPTDPPADPTAPETPDPTAPETPAATAPTAPATPPGGGGGGIAALAGAAATEPSSFEQELLDMLAARERRAEQDRWLSLAQFGLGLMSSREPTLGGAIGEAGQPALESLRSGRETAEADRLGMLQMLEQYRMQQQQLALQRAGMAARGGGGGAFRPLPSGALTSLMGQLSEVRGEMATLPAPPSPNLLGRPRQDPNAARRTQLQGEHDRLVAVLNAAGAPFNIPLGAGAEPTLTPLN